MKMAHINCKVAFQNCVDIPQYVDCSAKIIRDRVEVQFTLPITKTKLPFLFRVGRDGKHPHFINLPYYLEYSRYVSQLPADLRQLVNDIENFSSVHAVEVFNFLH